MIKSVLITGANAGLGKESARQLALQPGIAKVYLGCRSREKALAVKQELEESTGKNVFEIILIDVSDINSVRAAVNCIKEPVDALVMNAGGMGGKNSTVIGEGASQIFSVNLIGHVVLTEELLKAKKLTQVALYAGSEAARGVPKMGMKRPQLENSSTEEFEKIIKGTWFGNNADPMKVYGYVKYVAALWMSSMSRKYPQVRFVTVSPGSTSGTEVAKDAPLLMNIMFRHLGPYFMPALGLMHSVDKGARRYVDGLLDESYLSGGFYASKAKTLTGPTVDQATIFEDLGDPVFQDNAYQAIQRYVA
jgi:NAD(P)-dependent dehydrogenase (short-subunit alcohol dehydrogenase family)